MDALDKDFETLGNRSYKKEKNDETALENFYKTIKFVNDRYLVTWPWKDLTLFPPVNCKLDYHHMKTVWKRLHHQ